MSVDRPEQLNVWGVPLPKAALTPKDLQYVTSLPEELPSHSWVCEEMDRVWNEFGLNNQRDLASQPVDEFYRHPVWLMNGLFSAADPTSALHRRAIAARVAELAPDRVLDVGGGFGELALQISKAAPDATMHILEPFPSPVGLARVEGSPNVKFVSKLEDDAYGVVIAQDVLEHVEDPVGLAIDLALAVKPGGTAIFANNFTPIIQCHMPHTFHLKRTFRWVMRALGLRYTGNVTDAEHALLFEVPTTLHAGRARWVERISRRLAPSVEVAAAVRHPVRRATIRSKSSAT